MGRLRPRRILEAPLLVAGALAFLACSSSGGGENPTPAAPTTPVLVTVGDAPSDWILSFGMTVSSLRMTNTTGGTVDMTPSPVPVEMMQLMATTQAIALPAVPQGSYASATVTMASVTLGYMDPVSKVYRTATMAGPFTATVPFSPALTVGGSPMAMAFDLDMGASVSTNGSGQPTFAPVMTTAMGSASSGSQTPWSGGMGQRMGSVSAVSGGQFTLASMMGMPSGTFMTDAATRFSGPGLSGMGGMATGMFVAVDATLRPDGSCLATQVTSFGMLGASGTMGGGLITGITGVPPTQLTLLASMGQGGGMMPSAFGGSITLDLTAGTTFSMADDGVDLTNLPFTPAFGPSTLALGQRVMALNASGMMGGGMMGGQGTLSASALVLVPQALHGTVSGYAASGNQASFTLTLPADSAFTTLTGASTITVYQQASTRLHGLQAVSDGQDLAARGLLFRDAGAYKLVGSWITLP